MPGRQCAGHPPKHLIMPAEKSLSGEEWTRYARQVILPGVGPEGQRRLQQARVLVLGTGGLGSPAALYLAAAGIGTLGLADFDRVELHNLHRQILHSTEAAHSSRPKLDSAVARLREVNPHVQIQTHPEGLQPTNARALFAAYDIVVDGTDNFPTRYLANDAAFLTGIPLVYGAVFQFEGQASLFDPHRGGPCYRCLFPKMPQPGEVPNCAEAGVLGALCGIIGSLQALEAIRYILQLGNGLRHQLFTFDALSMTSRQLKIKADPACPLCGPQPALCDIQAKNYTFVCQNQPPAIASAVHNPDSMFSFLRPKKDGDAHGANNSLPMEISVQQAKELLAGQTPVSVLDVREDFEVAICALPGHIHIPLGQLGAITPPAEPDQPLLVYCHHGMRSLRAARHLRKLGFTNATSLKGGIDAWARKIDSQMPRY